MPADLSEEGSLLVPGGSAYQVTVVRVPRERCLVAARWLWRRAVASTIKLLASDVVIRARACVCVRMRFQGDLLSGMEVMQSLMADTGKPPVS